MYRKTLALGTAVVVTLFGSAAYGQDAGAKHEGHGKSGAGMHEGQAQAGSAQMHEHMKKAGREMQSMKMSGDVDRDFVTAMRKHHQDGIAMAKMVLEHGKDPKTREMAQRIMDEQQKDLKEFDAWLAEHGGDQPKRRAQGRAAPSR